MTEDQRHQSTRPMGNSLRVKPSINRVLCEYQSQVLPNYQLKKAVQRLVLTGMKENLKLVNKDL